MQQEILQLQCNVYPTSTDSHFNSAFKFPLNIANAMVNLKGAAAYQYLHSVKVGCMLNYKHTRFMYSKCQTLPMHKQCVLKGRDVRTAGCSCVGGPVLDNDCAPCI